MESTHSYSHDDIRRYLDKRMSVVEMHAFEVALMNDPFLSDAVEGFQSANATVTGDHLEQIEQTVHSGNKATVVPLTTGKTRWWRVAAIVVVVLTGGALIYSLFKTHPAPQTLNEITKAEATAPVIAQDTVSPAIASAAPSSSASTLNTREKSNQAAPTYKVGTNPSAAATLSAGSAVQADMTQSLAANQTKPALQDMATAGNAGRNMLKDYSKSVEERQYDVVNEFKGKVVNQQGAPVPYATLSSASDDKVVQANETGDFKFSAADTALRVDVSAQGYQLANARLKNNISNNIALNQISPASAGPVVTTSALGIQRSMSASTTVVRAEALSKTQANTPQPVTGWDYFKGYVNSRVDSLRQVDSTLFQGRFLIEMTIDKGHPTDIKALTKTDDKSLQWAKRILQEGSLWKTTGTEKKVRLSIPL